jgi:uncharacterized protein (TIGR03437 family)
VLSVNAAAINLAGLSQGNSQNTSIGISNIGGGVLSYIVTIAYQSGASWLTVTPASGTGNATLAVAANPAALQPGTYNATLTVNAGVGGTATIPVTFAVGQPGVTIQAVVSAASYQAGPIAPGSYVALFGLNLAGANIGVTFNGVAATVIPVPAPYNQTQINLIVPAPLSGSNATVVVTVNGQVSNTFNVALTPNVPGIFTPGILNSDSSLNSATGPAARGTFVQVYLTGLALPVVPGSVTVNIGGQTGIVPLYAGAQPTYPALDQINVTVPAGLALTGGSVPLSVCVAQPLPALPACSNAVTLYLR